jgi:hypothetical protein
MQSLTGSVGENGANNISDIALVQAILVKTQRAATSTTPAAPYLASYDGVCGGNTKAAIRTFQADHVFVSSDGTQSVANSRATAGLVAPNDATWAKLMEKVTSDFSDMRVLIGGKTVYIAATATQLQAKIAATNALTFAPSFRTKVIACINRMHTLHGIAMGVCNQGDRRDFQTQYNLLTGGAGVTNAGPGESNHNFGMAVDIGFEGLRWLQGNGKLIENETSWLHRLHAMSASEELKFWELLRSVGTSAEVGAFRGPLSDRPHLQNWDDAGVNMGVRLADLLTRSGTMRWSAMRGVYSSDLSMGGNFYALGRAAIIWNRQATVTVDMLTRTRAAQAARTGQQRLGMPLGAPSRPMQPGNPPQGAPGLTPVTQADVVAMQRELRRQFELADTNWQNWTPR